MAWGLSDERARETGTEPPRTSPDDGLAFPGTERSGSNDVYLSAHHCWGEGTPSMNPGLTGLLRTVDVTLHCAASP